MLELHGAGAGVHPGGVSGSYCFFLLLLLLLFFTDLLIGLDARANFALAERFGVR